MYREGDFRPCFRFSHMQTFFDFKLCYVYTVVQWWIGTFRWISLARSVASAQRYKYCKIYFYMYLHTLILLYPCDSFLFSLISRIFNIIEASPFPIRVSNFHLCLALTPVAERLAMEMSLHVSGLSPQVIELLSAYLKHCQVAFLGGGVMNVTLFYNQA